MWGIALEIEARISVAAATAATTAGEGASAATARHESIDLQEDVYGPFSGQVGRNARWVGMSSMESMESMSVRLS